MKGITDGDYPSLSEAQDGMTLRDYFAAQAIAGIMAHPANGADMGADDAARFAYQLADECLKERAK